MTKWTNEHVYYLSKDGAERIGVKPIKKSMQIDHHLLRNEAWLMMGMVNWEIEKPIIFEMEGKEKRIIPDAKYKTDTLYCIEIDRKQSMVRNKKKMELYGSFNYLYQALYAKKIILKVFTTLNSRKLLFENLAGEYGLACEVYVIDDI